uniref:Uncharacterized protein n=1 Tax=Ascaris lumbricoides TaxID=6252 RepID=A0A9J2P988_ASCLU
MQIISTVNARIALEAFASDFIRGDTMLTRHKTKSSSATSPEMAVTRVEAATSKTTPLSRGKQVNRVTSGDGRRCLKRKEGEPEMVSVPPRRRSAPKTFSPAPYLSSYKSADELPSMKRKMVDVSTPASSSSSDADSGPRNGSAVTRSPALEDSEDDLVVEAEVLSIEEKKLLVEVCVSNVLDTYMLFQVQVLNLCRNHVSKVDTNDRTWFSQLKLGVRIYESFVLLQIGELRRKINHATAKRNELREKCRQLHRKREACKHQRQVARLPVAFNSSDIDGSGGGGSGQQAVMMQPSRESSSGMRGQWIKVPESSHNEQQMTAISAFEGETLQTHTTKARLFDNRMRMQISKPGRASVTLHLARSSGGIPVPQRRRLTQLYNIADPNVIIDRNAQNPSLLSNSIPSR